MPHCCVWAALPGPALQGIVRPQRKLFTLKKGVERTDPLDHSPELSDTPWLRGGMSRSPTPPVGERDCALCHTGEEDVNHFLFKCRELHDLRDTWLRSWAEVSPHYAALHLRVIEEGCPLGTCDKQDVLVVNPKFVGVTPEARQVLVERRYTALGAMWSRRCRVVSERGTATGTEAH